MNSENAPAQENEIFARVLAKRCDDIQRNLQVEWRSIMVDKNKTNIARGRGSTRDSPKGDSPGGDSSGGRDDIVVERFHDLAH